MAEDFETAAQQLVEEYGLSMPPVHGTEQARQKYREYLERHRLSEDLVAPIIQQAAIRPEMRAQLLLGLIEALKSEDKRYLAVFLDLLRASLPGVNVNQLIGRISHSINTDLAALGFSIPEFFAGVYPIGTINAQCEIYDGLPLVLIDQGCCEMIEAAAVAFLSERNDTEKAELLIAILEDYFINRNCPDSSVADHPSVKWASGIVPALVTAAEEFVIAHELGHLVLGHLSETRFSLEIGGRQPVEVLETTLREEYLADVWAIRALVLRARKQADENSLFLSCWGVQFFLLIALLLEAVAVAHQIPISDQHPAAGDRIYLLEVALDVLGASEESGSARRFKKVIREVCVLLQVADRMPPMLSRELNRNAVEVFTDLGIEYKQIPYLLGFV